MFLFEMRWRFVALASVSALTLGACGTVLETAQDTPPPNSAFEAGLHGGYLQLSRSEYSEADYIDSDVFAHRAIAASRGTSVTPEAMTARDLPADKVDDLSGARQRLITALNATARTKVPTAASRAQVMFDCWMQEQEENFQPNDIRRCRSGYDAAMAEVEDAMRPPPPPPAPAVEAPTPAVPEPEEVVTAPRFYSIFFDFDSAAINDVASRVIGEIIADWSSQDGRLILVGHADSSGPANYNLRLSQRRAESVRSVLLEAGVGGGRLTSRAVGENNLAVPTADGVREPRNRRVTVTVE